MTNFRTILFAADFSENSQEAFRAACALADEGQTQLHVLHVVEPDWVPEEPPGIGQASVQFYEAARNGGRAEATTLKMREVYAPARPACVEYHTREGDPPTEILRLAEKVGADLIVVGTHGRTGLSWLLSGSVATAVMRRARCPVLALRARERTRKAGETPVLLHPTDFSASSEGAFQVACRLARELGARLVILTVAPFDLLVNDMVIPVDPQIYRDALDDVRRRATTRDPKYLIESRLGRGDAADEIIRTAAELDCSLIVMGSHGRTGLSRLLMGSVAESVLPRAECPVLIVKTSQPAAAPASSSDQQTENMMTVS
jgi:nucleotide-binding universal stress UspA family protein